MKTKTTNQKITDFTDLIVWNEAHALVLQVYKLTKKLPQNETFELVSQMRRCSVSITSNIAEGFARRTKKEKLQFYYTAWASLSELKNQTIICKDLGMMSPQEFQSIEGQSTMVRRLLNGFIKSSTEYTKYRILYT